MIDAGAYASTSDFINPDDFTHPGARAVAQAITDLISNGRDVDRVLVEHEAGKHADASDVRKALEVVETVECNAANADEYARNVRRMSDLRRIKEQAQVLAGKVDPKADPNELASEALDMLIGTATSGRNVEPTVSFGQLMERHHAQLAEELELRKQGKSVGILTGFSPWDSQTHGMREGELYLLAGEPGSGKTVVGMHMLRTHALLQVADFAPDARKAAMFVSLEMGDGSTANRWAQMAAGLTTPMLRGKELDDDVLAKVKSIAHDEGDIPLYANFSHGLYADQLKAVIANAVRLHGVKVVLIDHLRYVRLRNEPRDLNERDEKRIQYVHDEICKALGVTVILITHSTKASDSRDDKKPRMNDVRGSGQISAQCDGIAFMWRPYLNCTQAERENNVWSPTEAYLVWVKNRVDQVDDIPFSFEGSTMKFIDAGMLGRMRSQPQLAAGDEGSSSEEAPAQAEMPLDVEGEGDEVW